MVTRSTIKTYIYVLSISIIMLLFLFFVFLKDGMLNQHRSLIKNQIEHDGFIQIDSISATPGPSGRTWSYHLSLKSIEQTPAIAITGFYKKAQIYHILKDTPKNEIIPVKYVQKGRWFYDKPIFTEINNNRNFGKNDSTFDIIFTYGFIIFVLFFIVLATLATFFENSFLKWSERIVAKYSS